MKAKFATAILLLVLGAASLASAAPAIDISAGLLLGLNLGKVSGETSINDFRPGLSFGGFCNFVLNNVLSFEPEITFTQKGARHSEDLPRGGVVTNSINLSYFEIPVLLKISIPLGEDSLVRPRIFGGPTVAYMLSAKLKNRYEDFSGSENETATLTDTKKWETGFVVGVGADFDVKGGVFRADIRYGQSLATILTNPPDKKNKVLTIMIGFAFK